MGPEPLRGRRKAGGSVTAAVVVASGLVLAGLVAVLWRNDPVVLPPVATDLDRLPAAMEEAIAAFLAPRIPAGIVARVLAIVVPLAVVVSAPGRRMLARLVGDEHRGWRGPVRGAAVGAAVTLAGVVAVLPVRAWAGLVHDAAWQVRTASASAWWQRLGVAVLVDVGVAALLGAGLVLLVRRRPRTWALDLVPVGVAVAAAATLAWPTLVLPLTTPVHPLGDGVTADAVRDTVSGSGLDLPIVVSERSSRDTRSNAVVTGLGPTRRVVVDDTLLARPVDEVVAVVAHEAAHQQHRDVERAVLGAALLLLAVGVAVRAAWRSPSVLRRVGLDGSRAVDDPRLVAVALAVVAVLTPVVEPVALWQSRRVEAAADAAAFDLGTSPEAAVRMQRRLAIDNLSRMDVPRWQYLLWWSHPTPAERVRAAAARAAADGSSLPARAELEQVEAADPPAWSRPD